MTSEEARQYLLTMCNKSGKLRLEIAEWLGVHERTLYRWLSGESHIPTSVLRAMQLLVPPKTDTI